MKLNIYAIKDNVVGSFQNLLLANNDAEITRNVSVVVNQRNSIVSQNAGDLALYSFGTFDSETGVIVLNSSPECVISSLASLKEIRPQVEELVEKFMEEFNNGKEK